MSTNSRINQSKEKSSVDRKGRKKFSHSSPGFSNEISEEIGNLPLQVTQLVENPDHARPQDVLSAQRSYGNQAVQRVISGRKSDAEITNIRGELDEEISQSIRQAALGGDPLPATVQSQMNEKLGGYFNQVRIHTDDQADKISKQVNARAFTIGNDIFFRKGAYEPDSSIGQYTLAHELTHVKQQEGIHSLDQPIRLGKPNDRFEKAAHASALGQTTSASALSGVAMNSNAVQRDHHTEEERKKKAQQISKPLPKPPQPKNPRPPSQQLQAQLQGSQPQRAQQLKKPLPKPPPPKNPRPPSQQLPAQQQVAQPPQAPPQQQAPQQPPPVNQSLTPGSAGLGGMKWNDYLGLTGDVVGGGLGIAGASTSSNLHGGNIGIAGGVFGSANALLGGGMDIYNLATIDKSLDATKAGKKANTAKRASSGLSLTSNILGLGSGISSIGSGVEKRGTAEGSTADTGGWDAAAGSFGIASSVFGGIKSGVDLGYSTAGSRDFKPTDQTSAEIKQIHEIEKKGRRSRQAGFGFGMAKSLGGILGGVGSITGISALSGVGSGISLLGSLGQAGSAMAAPENAGNAATELANKIKAGDAEAKAYAKTLGITDEDLADANIEALLKVRLGA